MLNCLEIFDHFKSEGIDFFTGVPDSLLKEICACITDNTDEKEHIIAANEGNALALASGYHLATGRLPLVYMQNSGLGNCVNPLTSLTDCEVYSIPTLLFIGWRGEPGVKDEPQHVKKGRITPDLLNCMEIEHTVLSCEIREAKEQIRMAAEKSLSEKRPLAILVRKNSFDKYQSTKTVSNNSSLEREQAIELLVQGINPDAKCISTTGKISRELYETRLRLGQECADFLNVGAMGHVSQIALGVSLFSEKEIVCFDGDGAALMHLGSLAISGVYGRKNFKHIILNNSSHDSVGGQPTVADRVKISEIATSCNYKKVFLATTADELKSCLPEFNSSEGPCLLEVKVAKGSRSDLGRPKSTPLQNKQNFMDTLKS